MWMPDIISWDNKKSETVAQAAVFCNYIKNK
jgi:hypothetical protein